MTTPTGMTAQEHQATAVRLLSNLHREVGGNSGIPLYTPDHQARIIAQAQVHATLAQAAATLELATATAGNRTEPADTEPMPDADRDERARRAACGANPAGARSLG